MTDLTTMRGKQMKIQIAGEEINGILIDAGKDILVLYDGFKYRYLFLSHIHHIQQNTNQIDFVEQPTASTVENDNGIPSIKTILKNVKNTPCEMFISKDITFHGYITNTLDDYFAFYSPVQKMVYIPIQHLKWLIPYQNTTPYTLNTNITIKKSPLHLKVNPSYISYQPTFEEQLKKEEGNFVILDGGKDPMKEGLIKKVAHQFVELILANGESTCINLSHVKSVQVPS